MKKRLLLVGALSLSVLTACNNDTGKVIKGDLVDVGDFASGYDLLRDMNTGCVYIYQSDSSYSTPITAYYGEDGKVVGCGEKDFDKSEYE